jgi:glycosyltransferase involved in cell wall biosynthesis
MPGGFGHYGGSQSKMFQYMASGKPICANLRMMYCPITKYNLGIAQEFKNSQAYANAILSLLELNSDAYNQMCDRNKNAAQLFDYKRLASDLTQLF